MPHYALQMTTNTTIHLAGRTYRVVDERLVAYERCRIVDGKEVWYVLKYVVMTVKAANG